jgi:hypothetical protein
MKTARSGISGYSAAIALISSISAPVSPSAGQELEWNVFAIWHCEVLAIGRQALPANAARALARLIDDEPLLHVLAEE